MICPYCGKETKEEAQFCASCGHKIARCPSCDRVLRTNAKYCGFDGTLLPPELLQDLPERNAAPVPPVVPPAPPRYNPRPREEGPHQEPGQTGERSRLLIILVAVLIVLLLAVIVIGVGIWQGWFSSSRASNAEDTFQSEEIGEANGEADAEPEDDAAQTPEETEELEGQSESEETLVEVPVSARTYEIVASDLSWSEAREAAADAGGHLATITSQEEYDVICALAEDSGLKYLWLGAALTSDEMEWGEDGCWITGESWSFSVWYPGEPSLADTDGTQEFCLCLWNAAYDEEDIGWTFNDQRDNLVEDFPSVSGQVGYVIEFDDGYTAQ